MFILVKRISSVCLITCDIYYVLKLKWIVRFKMSCIVVDLKQWCPKKKKWKANILVRIHTLTLPASDEFCRLLMIFAISLDQVQSRQKVRPHLDPSCLTP